MRNRNPHYEVARILLAQRDARVAAHIRRHKGMADPTVFDVSERVARLLRTAATKGGAA